MGNDKGSVMVGGILKAIGFLVATAGIMVGVVAGLVATDVIDKADVDAFLSEIGLGSMIETGGTRGMLPRSTSAFSYT